VGSGQGGGRRGGAVVILSGCHCPNQCHWPIEHIRSNIILRAQFWRGKVFLINKRYGSNSPNMIQILLSCELQVLGIIVILLYAQYSQLLTSNSSGLISSHNFSQPRSGCIEVQLYTALFFLRSRAGVAWGWFT
jgi:hypothetical protein